MVVSAVLSQLPSGQTLVERVSSFLDRVENPVTDFASDYLQSTANGYAAGVASGVPYGGYIGAAGGALGSAYRFVSADGDIRRRNPGNVTSGVPLLTYNATPGVAFASAPAAVIADPGGRTRFYGRSMRGVPTPGMYIRNRRQYISGTYEGGWRGRFRGFERRWYTVGSDSAPRARPPRDRYGNLFHFGRRGPFARRYRGVVYFRRRYR